MNVFNVILYIDIIPKMIVEFIYCENLIIQDREWKREVGKHLVSKGTVRQTQNSEKPSFHGYISDRCLLPVVRAGIRQIIFLLPITKIGDKAGFDFRWRTLTPSVFYYNNYVFHNLIRFFCVKIAIFYIWELWMLINFTDFCSSWPIIRQLSNTHGFPYWKLTFGLFRFSPSDLNATLSDKKVWSRFTYLY